MSKPLMNRLLLENSNKPADLSPETLGKDSVPEWNQNRSVIKLWMLKFSAPELEVWPGAYNEGSSHL